MLGNMQCGAMGIMRLESSKVLTGDALKIILTGNPSVDTGLAVIAALKDLNDVEQNLRLKTIREVHGDGTLVSSWNNSLKNFRVLPRFHGRLS